MCRPTATSAFATSGGAASCITGTSTAGRIARNRNIETITDWEFALAEVMASSSRELLIVFCADGPVARKTISSFGVIARHTYSPLKKRIKE
jgi:hypothetical protein